MFDGSEKRVFEKSSNNYKGTKELNEIQKTAYTLLQNGGNITLLLRLR